MSNLGDIEAEVERLESGWQTMTSTDKGYAVDRLVVLKDQLPEGDSLANRIAVLQADIELASGLEPPTPEQGLKA